MRIDSFDRLTRLSLPVVVVLIALVVFGCAAPKVKMYPGSVLEESKQAVLQVDQSASRGGFIGIVRVDGKITTGFFTYVFSGKRWAREVSILPGKHNIITRIDFPPYAHAIASLWLVAEAGERYIIKAHSEGYRVKMWIENERTGQPTGGITGSDDEPKQN